MLSQLIKKVINESQIKFNANYNFSDSKVVIDWINGNPKRYKTFVASRITKINNNVATSTWHHVPSQLNPADCASHTKCKTIHFGGRGRISFQFPKGEKKTDPNDTTNEELISCTFSSVMVENVLPTAPSFFYLKRVMVYCLRLAKKCRNRKLTFTNTISVDELNQAEKRIAKILQESGFAEDLHQLIKHGQLKSNSRLSGLHPFQNRDGLLRVGGRLTHANIAFDAKHQILIPANHDVTKLIIEDVHRKTMHGGPKLVEAVLKQNYWITNAQRTVKAVTHKCKKCARTRGSTMQQLMANLPEKRINVVEKPFINCAIDYAGPIKIKTGTLRNRKIIKAYIAIFVCMAVKAIHIEPD